MKALKIIYNNFNELYCKKKAGTSENIHKLEKLREFCKDKQRCFIIGNGPSLNSEDLNLLKNEVTFACNRFFNIYDLWNPTIYFCQDPTILKNNLSFINDYNVKFKMISPALKITKKYCSESIFYQVNRKLYFKGKPPQFATDFSSGIYEGYSVVFSMIQAAVLLGFKEIYLLGVDFNYIIKDGKIDESSYPVGLSKTKGGGLPDMNYSLSAFNVAAQVCADKNIIIRNASRITKLEAFERCDLNKLF